MKSNLIRRARSGLTGTKRPMAAYLRRSVSDSYYALFHGLAEMSADSLVGATKRSTEAWRQVYRGLDHGNAKTVFTKSATQQLDPAIPRIAKAFSQLQEARHNADYDPKNVLQRRADAEAFVAMAEAALTDIGTLSSDARRDLAVQLVIKRRT